MSEHDQAVLAAGRPPDGFHYHGNTAALLLLTIKNALLNVVTLTLYRFWAKTDVRRHLWNQTRFQDDPLEYTGVGKELFLGFLLVLFVVLFPLAIANEALTRLLGPGSVLQIALIGLVLFLIGVARYRARRYRLSRTTWRGIRAAQTGAPSLYGLKALGFSIAFILTLGWSYPWQRIHLWRFEMDNTFFGDRKFRFDAPLDRLYQRFAKAWVMVIAAGALLYWITAPASDDPFELSDLVDPDLTPFVTAMILMVYGNMIAGIVLVGMVVLPFAIAWYRAGEFACLARGTEYEDMSISFDGDTWSLIKLALGNFFITLFTLGFGLPFVQMRKFRYFCDHIKIHGEADFDAIRQSAEERGALGEGLADAFDIGDF